MTRTGSVVLAASAFAFAAVTAVAPPAMAESTVPEVVALSVTPAVVSASGVTPAPVTIVAHVTSPVDRVDCRPTEYAGPGTLRGAVLAEFERTDAVAGARYPVVPLRLSSGTLRDGVWTGVLHAVSTMPGTWRIGSLSGCSATQEPVWTDVRGFEAAVMVSGSRPPTLREIDIPGVWGSVSPRFRVQVLNPDGSVPGTVRLGHGFADMCVSELRPFPGTERLDSLGFGPVWQEESPPDCVTVTSGAGVLFWRRLTGLYRFARVTLRPSTTSLRVAQTLRVSGVVWPVVSTWPRPTVSLQRRVSPSCWRNVASVRARASGRYDISATLRTVGRVQLRVRATSPTSVTGMVPTVSRAVVVTVHR